jgi:hypothetical protein
MTDSSKRREQAAKEWWSAADDYDRASGSAGHIAGQIHGERHERAAMDEYASMCVGKLLAEGHPDSAAAVETFRRMVQRGDHIKLAELGKS